jgi:uncharacterized protein (TIGR02271 family)
MATNYVDRLTDGMDVYDANGDKVGTVDEVYDTTGGSGSASGGGYLRVPTGFLGLGREHHIPFSAIKSVEGDRIDLRVDRNELDNLGYNEAPQDVDDEMTDGEPGTAATTGSTVTTDVARPAVAGSRTGDELVDETDTGRAARSAEERRRLQLREEELIPRKRSVQAGEVRLQTDVVSEQRTVEVPVTREEVYVERHPVDRRPSDRPINDTGETIEVPVSEEEVTVEKRSVVYEEVEVGKRAVQDTEQVDATVRREELKVDDQNNLLRGNAGADVASRSAATTGSAPTRATTGASASGMGAAPGTSLTGTPTTGAWAAAMPGYRSRWQQQYGTTGQRWEDVEPSYEYGYGLRNQDRYRGRSWSDIEPDVQRDWTATHPNTPWDRASQGIRDAWERATD